MARMTRPESFRAMLPIHAAKGDIAAKIDGRGAETAEMKLTCDANAAAVGKAPRGARAGTTDLVRGKQ